jgi:hypothetical protein
MIAVKATREGLLGHVTASGYIIETHVPFVALPSVRALRRCVRITRGGRTCEAIVLDVGPHYNHDDAYVFDGARPKAESDGSNGAGIDLGEYVWNFLRMTDNSEISWEFLT